MDGARGCKPRMPRRSGFTLIELMIVIVILGILITLVGPRILERPQQARRTAAKAQIRLLETSLDLFKADTGRYPTTTEGLEALVGDPGVKGWSPGGYIEHGKVPPDPWGKAYAYVSPGLHGGGFDIVCYGADGQQGGAGWDADVQSWNLEAD